MVPAASVTFRCPPRASHSDYELIPRPGAARFEEALVNFPGIYGLDAAIETLLELGVKEVERRVLELAALAMEC